MSDQLHLTRSDFEVEWFSGSGAGGQHRNKHQNCCRITHTATGIRAQCTAHRERTRNQHEAFYVLAARLLEHYKVYGRRERRGDGEVVRTYKAHRNEVIDSTGARSTYKAVVVDANLGELIEVRRKALATSHA